MNEEWWKMNEEWWKMNDEGWWFEAVEGFCFQTDGWTNGQTFAIVESLLRLINALGPLLDDFWEISFDWQHFKPESASNTSHNLLYI